DEEEGALPTTAIPKPMSNGASPVRPLVAYPDDDDDVMDILTASPNAPNSSEDNKEARQDENEEARGRDPASAPGNHPASGLSRSKSPPERLAEKRRREEDEEDELGKMMLGGGGGAGGTKRRSSASSANSDRSSSSAPAREGLPAAAAVVATATHGHALRRKSSLKSKDGAAGKRLGVGGPLSLALKSGRASQSDGDEDG
ncbi:hypothetical protein LTR28_002422, partial [Elasticomyces elasticus]